MSDKEISEQSQILYNTAIGIINDMPIQGFERFAASATAIKYLLANLVLNSMRTDNPLDYYETIDEICEEAKQVIANKLGDLK